VLLQAPIFDSLSFYPFALLDDGLHPAEVGFAEHKYFAEHLQLFAIICNYIGNLKLPICILPLASFICEITLHR